ncbi:MAG: DUF547 domain-containing protein [Gammaproteobacteria bacterium]|nr:DUF547 domain-containing protein [Gammaproteobacteria bacterium]
MKRLVGLAIVLPAAILITNIYAVETNTFTLSGEWIIVGSGTPAETQKVLNAQPTSVVVSRIHFADEYSPEELVIATGSFADGEVVLEGEIEERTEVIISVSIGEEESLTTNTVVAPGEDTRFALLSDESLDMEDLLLVVEQARIVEESKAKFTISGDLSLIDDKDLSIALAHVVVTSKNPKSDSILPSSDPVLLRDGRFSFEGIVSEPTLVTVRVRSFDDAYMGSISAVVEPASQIRISPSKTSSSVNPGFASELMAKSDSTGSIHHEVIESWQRSEEYLEKMDKYAKAIRRATQSSKTDSEFDESAHKIHMDMSLIKSSVLTPIAQDLEEPLTALLAMEYGALHGIPVSRKLENWDKLASVLDDDLVARRIVPQRERMEREVRVIDNVTIVVAGHKAPEFTLANLDGEDVALYDVLAKHELVLLDFWASWCGPCVEKLPKLKELRTAYKDQGFEIVFVSIDDTYEDWKEGTEKHEVPGVNVGDLHGFLAKTPVDYGVVWIPTEFLIDSEGVILDRGLTLVELENFLDERLGSGTRQEKTSSDSTVEQRISTGFDTPQPAALIPFWNANNESNEKSIDHSVWQNILDEFLVEHESGINRFDYKALREDEIRYHLLIEYVLQLSDLDPRTYSKSEQLAYWINLYNSLTVYLVAARFPVESVRDIKLAATDLNPLDIKLTNIKEHQLSLNDIRNGILRPIWQDSRIHYALNSASVSCPNLSKRAFTADNVEELLEEGAKAYVNHARGVKILDEQLKVSSIYFWYKEDFEVDGKDVWGHLLTYAKPKLAEKLNQFTEFETEYDWSVNVP